MVIRRARQPIFVIDANVVNWLAVIAAVVGMVQSLIEFLRDRERIDAVTAEVLLKSNREALDAISQANAARARVRADAERDPAGVMSDDGFKRHD
jgi:hypothetical protein